MHCQYHQNFSPVLFRLQNCRRLLPLHSKYLHLHPLRILVHWGHFLRQTKLDQVQAILSKTLVNLRKLVLCNCRLIVIPEGVFNVTGLEILCLANNSIQNIPEDIAKLTNLHTLDISNNDLKTIAASFANLSNLLRLHISNNPNLQSSTIQTVLACSNLKCLEISNIFPELSGELNQKLQSVKFILPVGLHKYEYVHVIPSKTIPKEAYRMHSIPKGVAIIVGNQNPILKDLFQGIGFEVVAIKDHVMREVECSTNLGRECDAFVMVIISRGNGENIVLPDSTEIHVDDLANTVNELPYEGKPMLFFILTLAGKQLSPCKRITLATPTDALYAFCSLQNDEEMSLLISILVEIFSNHAWEKGILSLLNLINAKVKHITPMKIYNMLKKKHYSYIQKN